LTGQLIQNLLDLYAVHMNFYFLIFKQKKEMQVVQLTQWIQFGQTKHANLDGMCKEYSLQVVMDLTLIQCA